MVVPAVTAVRVEMPLLSAKPAETVAPVALPG